MESELIAEHRLLAECNIPGNRPALMPLRYLAATVFMVLTCISGIIPAQAEEASVQAKQFPTSYFFQYHKVPLQEKEKILGRIDATLKKLNGEGYGLIAKGAVIEKLNPDIKTYPQLTILDESGLIIIAHQVPNLYYQYRGGATNPNIYLIIKKARVNFPESYIRYGYVVEGDYEAYAHKFVTAILDGLERTTQQAPPPPHIPR
jgi:hypothetical protein